MVYVVDTWIKFVRERLKEYDIKIAAQYHDEILLYFPKNHKDAVEKILKESMEKVNNLLKLNVHINISIDFGKNYAEVH